jgi:hypothetical protein
MRWYEELLEEMMTKKPQYTINYQDRDDELFDYGFWSMDELPGLLFRGPAVDLVGRDDYVTCLGAAQTLGVYASNPFPQLLSQKYGLPVWNLGIGGADPGFFLQHDKLFSFINKSRLVVLQIMTARSCPNDRMDRSPYAAFATDRKRGDKVIASDIWQRVIEESPQELDRLIEQSRKTWHRELGELITRIEVPILFFWFSPKRLDQRIDITKTNVINIIDVFPQFITGEDLHFIKSTGHPLAVCHSARSMEFPLRSKRTGKVVEVSYDGFSEREWKETHNIYYPSPEMHWDAAESLIAAIDKHKLLEAKRAAKQEKVSACAPD